MDYMLWQWVYRLYVVKIGGEAKRELGNFKLLNLIFVTCNSCGFLEKMLRLQNKKLNKILKKFLKKPFLREQGSWKEHSAIGKANFLTGAGGNTIQCMKTYWEIVAWSTKKLDTVTPAVPFIAITIGIFWDLAFWRQLSMYITFRLEFYLLKPKRIF